MIDTIPVLRIAAFALGLWVAAVWIVGALYIVISYIEAVPHIPGRSFGDLVRSIAREAWYVAWTQPMLPVFQFILKRMGSGGGDVPVVLVHGYCQNRVDFLYLAKRLRAMGSGPLFAVNFFWPQPLETSADTLCRFVERVRTETGADKVDLLTHSSGGLLAMDLLARHPEWVRRTAVIAVPWRGVTWKGPVLGPSGAQLRAHSLYTRTRPQEITCGCVLSVYSAHDNLVHPPKTSQLSGPDVTLLEVPNLGHLAVLFDRRVGDAVCEFLVPQTGAELSGQKG